MTESPCILVVEDDAATRTFLADNLTADGYELLVAGSVRALRLLESHHVDLAVVDVGLPDASGLEVIRTVHSFDPCLACAIHMLDTDRRQLVRVKAL